MVKRKKNMFLVVYVPVKPMVSIGSYIFSLGETSSQGSAWDSWDYSWKGKGRVSRRAQRQAGHRNHHIRVLIKHPQSW